MRLVSILITLTSFLGNFLIVYVDSRLKSWTNIFIQNLALTAISIWHRCACLFRGACIFSERWCEVQAVIEATLGIASILTMGLIAFNRYIRVVKQALYNRLFPSKRTARLYRGVVRIASTFFATPPLCGWGKVVYHRRYAICNFVICSGNRRQWEQHNHSCSFLLLLQNL